MSLDALQEALRETIEVVELGDAKHGLDAWRETQFTNVSVVSHIAGAIRHLGRRLGGQTHEVESTRRHLAHAAARSLIALQLEIDRENRRKESVITEYDKMPWLKDENRD